MSVFLKPKINPKIQFFLKTLGIKLTYDLLVFNI